MKFVSPDDLFKQMVKAKLKYNRDFNGILYTPDEIWKYKKAICWDYALMEYYYINQLDYDVKYIFMDNIPPNKTNYYTHTTVIFKPHKFNIWYWFEYSWFRHKGIYGPYDTIENVKDDVRNKFIDMSDSINNFMEVNVTSIINKPNLTENEFFNCMFN